MGYLLDRGITNSLTVLEQMTYLFFMKMLDDAQIGVDRVVAVERFGKFLSGASLNTMQEEYLKTIITYVCENGDITAGTLVNVSPFSEYDWVAIFGQNLVSVRDYVNNLHSIIQPTSTRLRA